MIETLDRVEARRRRIGWYRPTLVLLLLASALYQLSFINAGFERSAEGCGAFFGLLARNYFRYPWSTSHAIPIMSQSIGCPIFWYANHPPTTPLLVYAAMLVSGYRGDYVQLPPNWTMRIPTLLATLACAFTLAELIRRRRGARAGLLAAALFLFIPMTLIYGRFPDVISPQLIFGILLTIAAYERFADEPTLKSTAVLCAAFTLAGIVDWPAFYIMPLLGLHYICSHSWRKWWPFVLFGLFGTALFLGLYAYLTTAQPSWRWMVSQFAKRSNAESGDFTGAFTLGKWLYQSLWVYMVGRHTLFVVVAAIGWSVIATLRRLSRERSVDSDTGAATERSAVAARIPSADRFCVLLLTWGVLHVLIGRQGVFQHEWWWWPITPGLVAAAALFIDRIIELIAPRRAVAAVLVLLGIGWAGSNIRSAIIELHQPSVIEPGPLNYTLAELGDAVRHNVPPDSIFLITEIDQSLAGWYYLDRCPKRMIWDIASFEDARKKDWITISFDLYEKWPGGPVKRMVIPKVYLGWVGPLKRYLDERFTAIDLPKFVIYDLENPTRNTTLTQ